MSRRKLTLTVDEVVIARAHAYSEIHGTSISQLVTDFLSSLASASDERNKTYTPTVRRLLGLLPPETDIDVYRRHLDDKYAR